MQINRVKNNAALRGIQTNICEMFASEVTSTKHYHVEVRAVRHEIVAHRCDVGVINHFDPPFLQLASIWWNVGQIIGNESNAMTELAE